VALALAAALAVPVEELLGVVKLDHLQQPAVVPLAFAQQLRERRTALRLTARALAGHTGLHHSYISQLERGVSHPSRAVAAALARALDLPVEALVGEGFQERARPETGLPATLRARRETLEMSQAVVARRAGISQSYVKAIESGRSRPSREVIAQLARTVEMSEDDLLEEEDRAAFRARGQPAPGLGARLRDRRQTLGLSDEALAARAGVTATSLSQIERGVWLPSRVVAQTLATALGLRLEELVDAPTLARLRDDPEEHTGFAQRLAERRAALRLTQAALADAAGLAAHYISTLEQGHSQPSVEVATALAAALGTPLEDLLGEVNPGDLHAWHPRYVGLGPRLRDRRAILRLTQDDLARRVGISRPALSRLEHELVEPTARLLIALATALDTTPEALRGTDPAPGADALSGGAPETPRRGPRTVQRPDATTGEGRSHGAHRV